MRPSEKSGSNNYCIGKDTRHVTCKQIQFISLITNEILVWEIHFPCSQRKYRMLHGNYSSELKDNSSIVQWNICQFILYTTCRTADGFKLFTTRRNLKLELKKKRRSEFCRSRFPSNNFKMNDKKIKKSVVLKLVIYLSCCVINWYIYTPCFLPVVQEDLWLQRLNIFHVSRSSLSVGKSNLGVVTSWRFP